jgi:hypothetical protein
MKLTESFPSKFLKASDFPQDKTLTIREFVQSEQVGKTTAPKDQKPALYFHELEKGLVLNKVNANVIESMYPGDVQDLIGRKITLYATETEYNGNMVPCIRVRRQQPQSNQQSSAPQSGQAGDAAAMRAESLMKAWNKFRTANASDTPEMQRQMFGEVQKKYFNGRPHQSIGAHEWIQFAADNFVKPAPPDPFANEPAAFDDKEIPF